jgi:hypothetical protein
VLSPCSWPISPAGSTGTLKCAPGPPPGKTNQLRTGPLTAPPRPAKGDPRQKGSRGNLTARPGVRRNHPQLPRPQANAARLPAEFLHIKFLGEKKAGGVFFTWISPGRKNGMNNILGLVSGASVITRGGTGVPLRLCLQGREEGHGSMAGRCREGRGATAAARALGWGAGGGGAGSSRGSRHRAHPPPYLPIHIGHGNGMDGMAAWQAGQRLSGSASAGAGPGATAAGRPSSEGSGGRRP